jgi:hypothetical protein
MVALINCPAGKQFSPGAHYSVGMRPGKNNKVASPAPHRDSRPPPPPDSHEEEEELDFEEEEDEEEEEEEEQSPQAEAAPNLLDWDAPAPAPVPEPAPAGQLSVAEIRQRLVDFYQGFDPSKLQQIDSIMQRYAGKEQDILQVIAKQGGQQVPPAPSPQQTATQGLIGGLGEMNLSGSPALAAQPSAETKKLDILSMFQPPQQQQQQPPQMGGMGSPMGMGMGMGMGSPMAMPQQQMCGMQQQMGGGMPGGQMPGMQQQMGGGMPGMQQQMGGGMPGGGMPGGVGQMGGMDMFGGVNMNQPSYSQPAQAQQQQQQPKQDAGPAVDINPFDSF